jgi:hypothetical protein
MSKSLGIWWIKSFKLFSNFRFTAKLSRTYRVQVYPVCLPTQESLPVHPELWWCTRYNLQRNLFIYKWWNKNEKLIQFFKKKKCEEMPIPLLLQPQPLKCLLSSHLGISESNYPLPAVTLPAAPTATQQQESPERDTDRGPEQLKSAGLKGKEAKIFHSCFSRR